jgi:sulfate adenylyltransferase
MATPERRSELMGEAVGWPSHTVTTRQMGLLELLLTGALSPLRGFMNRSELETCTAQRTLPDGTFWPAPVVLDVAASTARTLSAGASLMLRDLEGAPIAAMHVDNVWDAAGSASGSSPRWLAGGRVEGLTLPVHYDFPQDRPTLDTIERRFTGLVERPTIAITTTGLVHRAELKAIERARQELGADLIVFPLLEGIPDVRYYARIRCFEQVCRRFPEGKALLSLLTGLTPRSSSDWLLPGIVARNHGCTHMLVLAEDIDGFEDLARELRRVGIDAIDGRDAAARTRQALVDVAPAAPGAPDTRDDLIGRILQSGGALPGEISLPETSVDLARLYRPPASQGFTVFFSGLSGSGKSTIANALRSKLLERDAREVTLLDGDLVRRHLSSELGFSPADRALNIRRIAFVAAEITKNGGVAICAPIAPEDDIRREVRRTISAVGGFILVHVDTPLDVCEARDRKGLYAKARAGLISEFTGVSAPYERPTDADVVIDTTAVSAADAATRILAVLTHAGYVSSTE